MGTETEFTAFLVAFLVVFVKLNNPQMGTETNLNHTAIRSSTFFPVKLNNPQMGTETTLYGLYYNSIPFFLVKLNNPQMGTETFLIVSSTIYSVLATC